MSCEHAQTTTVAWLYDEAPDEHIDHIAHCKICANVVALHEEVLALTYSQRQVPKRRGTRGPFILTAFALAAAALLVLKPNSIPVEPTDTYDAIEVFAEDELDQAFDELELELSTLEDDFSTF